MSASMVKKAMALVGDNCAVQKEQKGFNQGKYSTKVSLQKRRKREKRKLRAKAKLNILDECKKNIQKDNTKANIAKLLQLSSGGSVVKKAELKEILKHHKGRLCKNQRVADKPKPSQKTVFTEADFAKFEREYIPKHRSEDVI